MLWLVAISALGIVVLLQRDRIAELESEFQRLGLAKPFIVEKVKGDNADLKKFGLSVSTVLNPAFSRDVVGVVVRDQEHVIPSAYCLKVIDVFQESPAFRSGIFEGDVIVAICGEQIKSHEQLLSVLAQRSQGKFRSDSYVVERNGEWYVGFIDW